MKKRERLIREEKRNLKKEKGRIIAIGMFAVLSLATIVLTICTLHYASYASTTLFNTGLIGVIVMYVICEGEIIVLFLIAWRELREKKGL